MTWHDFPGRCRRVCPGDAGFRFAGGTFQSDRKCSPAGGRGRKRCASSAIALRFIGNAAQLPALLATGNDCRLSAVSANIDFTFELFCSMFATSVGRIIPFLRHSGNPAS
jgi:hypothetical protein